MPNTHTPTVVPLEQNAQKCAWCYNYLYIGQDCADYNGSDQRFTGWICHADCNISTDNELSQVEPLQIEQKNERSL
jgi:hypothetical protein